LLALDDICGYSTVFQRGTSPAFIFKESSSAPRVIGLSGKPVKGLTSFHTSICQRGFAYLDSTDTLRISQLPPQTHYGHLGWATRHMPMDAEVHALAYHKSGLYIVGTGQVEEYQLDPTETYHYDLPKEDMSFRPTIERGVIKLLDEKSWTIVDTHMLDPQEVVLSIKTLNLEVSETSHQRKDLIAVGTAVIHGEDLATKGCIRIFEVITVVPEPGRPETNKRLKLIVKDEVKGAVSAISELGTQGFLIMAQGQKCMVRGLKEDATLLPVAFMDMQTYVSDIKNLPGTGMLAMSDAYRGVWFTGYTVSHAFFGGNAKLTTTQEEPYKMSLFSRSKHSLEAIALDFLPFESSLHIVVADADMNLQVLQFDPDSTSLSPFPSPTLSLSMSKLLIHPSQTPNQKPVPACSTNPLSTRATSPPQCTLYTPTCACQKQTTSLPTPLLHHPQNMKWTQPPTSPPPNLCTNSSSQPTPAL
jgi:cleavage and polyadenylation specificity factor subunit 1